MYIKRELEEKIKPFLKRKEALSIIGPRQAGKTTFIRHLEKEIIASGKKVRFFTFENRNDSNLFQKNIDDFKEYIKSYDCVIIDEFQYAKDGGQKLKYLYDTTGIKFIISGSLSLELTFQTGKYMVGRLLEFKLPPFSFREFLSFEDKELHSLLTGKMNFKSLLDFDKKNGFGEEITRRLGTNLEKYVIYGGYPEVVLAKSFSEKEKILEGIVSNYLLKDIKSLLKLATEEELLTLAKLLALQIGNIIRYKELSSSTGLNYKGLIRHINILKNTFILDLIRPYFTNRRVELVKNPKCYFLDTGIRNYLISDFRDLESRNDRGAIMENYVFNMLGRQGSFSGLKYWRTKSKAEVDFVIETEQKIFPIEVKYASKRVVGKSLYSFLEKFEPPTGIILTKDYLAEEKIGKTRVKFIPLSYF